MDARAGIGWSERGLRTQIVMATGSGKTLVAQRTAEKLRAARVLVLVPSLDLLTQTAAAWREDGRTGAMVGVSSLRGDDARFPNTTDAEELALWCRDLEKVTVFATYASLGLGTLERAHRAGLAAWSLICVDEAHRTSGTIGKPWAVVHDNLRVPADRRLYMTATPRLWQLGEDNEGVWSGELVASMDDDPSGVFGARCHTLSLSDAIDRRICAPYQVVVVEVTDPTYQTAALQGADATSQEMRGTRLAALQTALVKAAAEQDLTRTLVFHHRIAAAEAFAAGLPEVAAKLHASEPELYPKTVWADWLSGDHKPGQRKWVLDEFASRTATDGTAVEKSFLSSVKVLGEGVDTAQCDSVFFADVRGSMPDFVQAVGRALRMHPGEDKLASLVVPVLLAPGETPETMLTSKSYDGLARLSEALRAHDARVVETLAQPQAPSRYTPATEGPEPQPGTSGEVSERAEGLLRFSTPRDPTQLAAFVELRVINPEREHWRRGINAAIAYTRAHGDLKIPYGFTVPDTDDWPTGLAGFPLGRWIAEARRAHGQGRLDKDRIEQLDRLGTVCHTSTSPSPKASPPPERGPANTAICSPPSTPPGTATQSVCG